MIKKTQSVALRGGASNALRLGFVPLTDCAPLVIAKELGLFRKFGLKVSLSRELGWATVRDKIIHRELDAAHAVAGMPFAATLGLGSIACECVTGLVLNQHGNAITLSADLWQRGVRDAVSLRQEIVDTRRDKVLTFGVVHPFSSHSFLLRRWLRSGGIEPDRDIRVVVVPPPQMPANLRAGHLDGFCAGEPWNSVAVESRAGRVAATSPDLAPGHPEKVLMVCREFAEKRSEEHIALLAALLEACKYCDQAENRNEVVALLTRPEYVGVPAGPLRRGFDGEFDLGDGRSRKVAEFHLFHRHNANEPTERKAAWVLNHVRERAQLKESALRGATLRRRVFRMDLFERAIQFRNSNRNTNAENEIHPETHSIEV